MHGTVVVSGCDHRFFRYLIGLLDSVERHVHREPAPLAGLPYDFLALDFGLRPDQAAQLRARGVRVVKPDVPFEVPEHLREPRHLSYLTRPFLPRYVEAHHRRVIWLDADTWLQDGRLFPLAERALDEGDRLVVHDEAGSSFSFEAFKWTWGNLYLAEGLPRALTLFLRAARINCGVFGLRKDSIVWLAWQERYRRSVLRTGNSFLDQHSLISAVHFEKLPTLPMPAAYNFVCSRRQPRFEAARGLLTTPTGEAISVVHLAGHGKDEVRVVPCLFDERRSVPLRLTYGG